MEQFFATCPRGLEAVLAQELTALGAEQVSATDGGARFSGPLPMCYRVNLESRIASRVLWQIDNGYYRTEDDIYKHARNMPWDRWFTPHQTIAVKVTAQRCPLRSLDFITLRIKDAICDFFRDSTGIRPSVDTRLPDVRIHAYFDAQQFTLYLDTSGEALFKRGYRQYTGEAPLRENLAAGILKLSGWEPGMTLLDPMCGSGTFVLEAAQMALHMPSGLKRVFGFERLKNFEPQAWEPLRAAAAAKPVAAGALPIYGSDIDKWAVMDARKNIDSAGLTGLVKVEETDILDIVAPAEKGVLVMNPPYGERIGEADELAELYPKLGSVLKQRFAGWKVGIFTADLRLPKLMRLKPSRKIPLFNGPIECRLFLFEMVAGSNRS
jgi:putative N6-adenine-specific DNA methylase